jgi:monofunctional biosynthetic peptidoglycan transglycosylase
LAVTPRRQKKSTDPQRRSLAGRLRRLLLAVALFLVAGSIASVGLLRWFDPPYSMVMLLRALDERTAQQQYWIDLDAIAPAMALAVVSAEDQRFPRHWGFDTVEILAAVERHLDGGRLRGASTISQQVARNLFLWQGRSLARKALEVWFTVLIEGLWSKRRILEMYLNFAETGPRRFGVELAAREAFGVSAADLSQRQAALIAAALPNPVRYRIEQPGAYMLQRRAWILEQMRNLGVGYLVGIVGPQSRGSEKNSPGAWPGRGQ